MKNLIPSFIVTLSPVIWLMAGVFAYNWPSLPWHQAFGCAMLWAIPLVVTLIHLHEEPERKHTFDAQLEQAREKTKNWYDEPMQRMRKNTDSAEGKNNNTCKHPCPIFIGTPADFNPCWCIHCGAWADQIHEQPIKWWFPDNTASIDSSALQEKIDAWRSKYGEFAGNDDDDRGP